MNNDFEARLKDLILNTCNKVGCKDCPQKWDKDSDGNSCSSDYLMMMIAKYEAGEWA